MTAALMNTHVRDNLRVTTHAIGSDNALTETNTTTAEVTAWSFTVSANTLGTTGLLHLVGTLKWHDSTASNPDFTLRYKYGGQTFFSHTRTVDDEDVSAEIHLWIIARGATNVQQAHGQVQHSTWDDAAAPADVSMFHRHKQLSVDSTFNQALVVTVQMNVSNVAASWQKQGALVQAVST
ncbi:MAG: hypothetical protein GEU73_06115 [Chloroflexi bacterium]|nr:hypothetical protein [Chloroflexota bacterium]